MSFTLACKLVQNGVNVSVLAMLDHRDSHTFVYYNSYMITRQVVLWDRPGSLIFPSPCIIYSIHVA